MAPEKPQIDWKSLRIGMLGGDRREQEIARRVAAAGARVRAHGFPWPEGGIPGVTHLTDPAAVLENAKFALFPIPGIATSGTSQTRTWPRTRSCRCLATTVPTSRTSASG